jgi:hypothetical protein
VIFNVEHESDIAVMATTKLCALGPIAADSKNDDSLDWPRTYVEFLVQHFDLFLELSWSSCVAF